MAWKQQEPKPVFDMPEVILLVPQPLHTDRASSPLDAANSLHPAGGLTWQFRVPQGGLASHGICTNRLYRQQHVYTQSWSSHVSKLAFLYRGTCLYATCPLGEGVHTCFSGWRGTEILGITYRRVVRNLYLFINILYFDSPVVQMLFILHCKLIT